MARNIFLAPSSSDRRAHASDGLGCLSGWNVTAIACKDSFYASSGGARTARCGYPDRPGQGLSPFTKDSFRHFASPNPPSGDRTEVVPIGLVKRGATRIRFQPAAAD